VARAASGRPVASAPPSPVPWSALSSPSYWVARLTFVYNNGFDLQASERVMLRDLVTTGMPSWYRRHLMWWLGGAWLLMTFPALGISALLVSGLHLVESFPATWIVVGFLPGFTLAASAAHWLQYALAGDDERPVVWRPLLVDFGVAVIALLGGLATFIHNSPHMRG